jgi:hypothetical protein
MLVQLNGSTVAASGIDTLQAGAGGRIAVNARGHQFPRKTEFSKFCDGEPASIAEAAARSIAAGTVFLLRQQDRYIDTGTGQVRSRAWNDPDKYLVLGETGDACPQIWWTGNRGVKTGAGATSCVRIPNAYIDPDAAFSVTLLVASLPGNTVAHRPLLMVGSQHGTLLQARALVKQHDTMETHCIYNASDATYGYSLAGICPYAVTVAAATGAGGSTSFYRNGALHVSKAKVAGAIFADDHVIGGYWDETGGVWVSYKGFYVMGVIIHTTQISAEVVELHRALVGMDKVPAAISIGQSNNGLVGGAVPDAPALPSYAAASNETSVNGLGIGWGPIEPQKYGDEATGSQYSVTHGIAPSLPGHALFKITLGGHQMTSFYDWTAADFEVIYEPLMRAAWQLGCSVDLRHIFVISGESEADISLPAVDVRNRLIELSARYRRGFQQNLSLQSAIRVTLNQLNNQYALVRPVGTPLVRSGQALFAAADANARMVDVDAIPLGVDNTHYSANDRIRVGMLLGAAAIGA